MKIRKFSDWPDVLILALFLLVSALLGMIAGALLIRAWPAAPRGAIAAAGGAAIPVCFIVWYYADRAWDWFAREVRERF